MCCSHFVWRDRQKTYGVFTKAKQSLQNVLDKTTVFINSNYEKVDLIEKEKIILLEEAVVAKNQMDKINKSISQINSTIEG